MKGWAGWSNNLDPLRMVARLLDLVRYSSSDLTKALKTVPWTPLEFQIVRFNILKKNRLSC